jgi:hypothetical protein
MDLNDLTFRDTYTHTILHPITRDPVQHKDGDPQTVTLYGSDSKGYRNALAEVARLGIDDPDERLMAFLALITTAWHVYAGGSDAKLEDAKKVYGAMPSQIRDQIFAAASERANFFAGPSTGS